MSTVQKKRSRTRRTNHAERAEVVRSAYRELGEAIRKVMALPETPARTYRALQDASSEIFADASNLDEHDDSEWTQINVTFAGESLARAVALGKVTDEEEEEEEFPNELTI